MDLSKLKDLPKIEIEKITKIGLINMENEDEKKNLIQEVFLPNSKSMKKKKGKKQRPKKTETPKRKKKNSAILSIKPHIMMK